MLRTHMAVNMEGAPLVSSRHGRRQWQDLGHRESEGPFSFGVAHLNPRTL